MVRILLTDVKQRNAFLKLPFKDQKKKGLILELNSNESQPDFFSNPQNEDKSEGSTFFLKTYGVSRKDIVSYLGDFCKDRREGFTKGLNELSEQEGFVPLSSVCESEPTNTPFDETPMDIQIKSGGKLKEYLDEGFSEDDMDYEIQFDFPLGLSPNPKDNNPHDWLVFLQNLTYIEGNIGDYSAKLKDDPFFKEDQKYMKRVNKQAKKEQSKQRKIKQSLIPTTLLGKEIKPENPDQTDNDVVFIGFLDSDRDKSYFVKQKIQ